MENRRRYRQRRPWLGWGWTLSRFGLIQLPDIKHNHQLATITENRFVNKIMKKNYNKKSMFSWLKRKDEKWKVKKKSLKIRDYFSSFQTIKLSRMKEILNKGKREVWKAHLYVHDKLLTVFVSLYHRKLFILYEKFSFKFFIFTLSLFFPFAVYWKLNDVGKSCSRDCNDAIITLNCVKLLTLDVFCSKSARDFHVTNFALYTEMILIFPNDFLFLRLCQRKRIFSPI